nr:MAG TPA: hypothetical protein [Caudoviricetes sp.]
MNRREKVINRNVKSIRQIKHCILFRRSKTFLIIPDSIFTYPYLSP